MSHENEKTLATYDVAVVAGLAGARASLGGARRPLGWAFGRFLGPGVRRMTATDRRLVVDYGRTGHTSLHYGPGMIVDCRRARLPFILGRLLLRALCLSGAAVLLLGAFPSPLFAALPLVLLAVSVCRDAFVVRVEVSLPLPDRPGEGSVVRALLWAAGPRRKRLWDFVERLDRAVADHNAPPSGTTGAVGSALPSRPGEGEGGILPAGVAPRDLSLRDLLSGASACGAPEDHESALSCALEHETRRLAFSPAATDDPSKVVGGMPGLDVSATRRVFGGPKDAPGRDPKDGVRGAFVFDVPRTFPHERYVASYAAPEGRSGRGETGDPFSGPSAISAWLSEAPLRAGDGEGLPTWLPWLFAAVRALRHEGSRGPLGAWLCAFPGLRPYEPRVRARWRLQPAGRYRVRMNFHEEVEGEDFYAPDGGLRDAYPPSLAWGRAPGSAEGVDLLTGDVTVRAFREAVDLAAMMGDEFAERGVLCDPKVELADGRGHPFELGDDRWPWSAPASDREDDEADPAAVLFAQDERGFAHLPLRGLAATVPSREAAEHFLLRADGFVRTTRRMAALERRLADGRIPPVRKDVLGMQLAEQRRRHDETLRALTKDPAVLVALLASVERERELVRGVLSIFNDKGAGTLHSLEARWRLGELERLRRGTEEDRDG